MAEKDSSKDAEPSPQENGNVKAISKNECKQDSDKTENGVQQEKSGPGGDEKGQENSDKKDKKKMATEKPKKAVKKTIPRWATAKLKNNMTKVEPASDMLTCVVNAMEILSSELGTPVVSAFHLKRQLQAMCPSWPKFLFKRALKKAVTADRIKPVKGSFRLVSNPKPSGGREAAKSIKMKAQAKSNEKLDDLIGNIFTWVCEPKEASISLIKKYIDEHHSSLSTGGNMFKKAIENGIARGQLDRINGKGMSGTVQLVDGAKKTGTNFEDAIEDAIIACNEPKDASIAALKHYLSEYHTEFNVAKRPKVLMNCLERCEAKGWIVRITGKGMSGSFRLTVPYRPAPKELWGEWYEDPKKATPSKTRKESAKHADDSDEGESASEEEEEESEESDEGEIEEETEIIPKKKKRGAPTPRKVSLPPKKRKLASPHKKTANKSPPKKMAKKSPTKKKPAAAAKRGSGRTKK